MSTPEMEQLTPYKPQKHDEDGQLWIVRCCDLCWAYRCKGIHAELRFNSRGKVAVFKEIKR
jgi:hypothetical protein